MLAFIGGLIRPYRSKLVLIFLAMLLETLMSLAAPWPLKIILDSVVGNHKLAPWLHHLLGPLTENTHRLHVAALASLAFVLIAVAGRWQPTLTITTPRASASGSPMTSA